MRTNESENYAIAEAQVVSETSLDPESQRAKMGLHDYLSILFSHKKKIIALGAAGLVAATCAFFLTPPVYVSEAKLEIPYVVSRNAIEAMENEVTVASDRHMNAAMNAEIDLITSWDLAADVVAKLRKTDPTQSGVTTSAAEESDLPLDEVDLIAVKKGMTVVSRKDGNVLLVSYQHRDPKLAVAVLDQIVECYQRRHATIRRSGAGVSSLEIQVQQLFSDLKGTMAKIDELKATNNIGSLEESQAALRARRAKVEEELITASAKLAALEFRLSAIDGVPTDESPEPAIEPEQRPTDRDTDAYRNLREQLAELNRVKATKSVQWKETSFEMKQIRQRISDVEGQLRTLADKFPSLASTVIPAGAPNAMFTSDPQQLALEVAATKAYVKSLQASKADVDQRHATLSEVSSQIAVHEHTRKNQELQHSALLAKLENAMLDRKMSTDGGDIPNIQVLQNPSIPQKQTTKSVRMILGALAFGGLALGVFLALFIDLIWDKSVKRPGEFESRLRLPLMMSIPFLSTKDGAQPKVAVSALSKDKNPTEDAKDPRIEEITPLQEDHFIRPFADAIRDRLGYHFRVNKMTHKPKLIALTGLSDGAGTSTLAAGLAAAFAETSEGKVLYLDLNPEQRESGSDEVDHSKANGATLHEKQGIGMTEHRDNLFIATVPAGNGGTRRFRPNRFYELLPQFKTSDFDYVIFDLPPLEPTSPTLAMAGFMDKVLLVIDAGKTSRDVLKHYHGELAVGDADVSSVLNKTRESLPTWLQG